MKEHIKKNIFSYLIYIGLAIVLCNNYTTRKHISDETTRVKQQIKERNKATNNLSKIMNKVSLELDTVTINYQKILKWKKEH